MKDNCTSRAFSCPINPEALGSALPVASSPSPLICECGAIRDERPAPGLGTVEGPPPGIASDGEGSAVTFIFQTFKGRWKSKFFES
jgi:hypothetical protein